MKQLTAICIGAGGRGRAYSNIMSEMPEKFKQCPPDHTGRHS